MKIFKKILTNVLLPSVLVFSVIFAECVVSSLLIQNFVHVTDAEILDMLIFILWVCIPGLNVISLWVQFKEIFGQK